MFKRLILLGLLVLLIVSSLLPGCGGGSSKSKPDATPPPPPASPLSVTVTPADKQLTVEWTSVYGATGYEVWYSTTNDPSTATQVTDSFTGTSCIITELINGTIYYIWVRATNSGGTSEWSSVGTGEPVAAVNPPGNPGAPVLKGGDKEITVIWESVTGATGYEVWYATTNNTSSAVKSVNTISGTGTTIMGLTNGSTYYVWVKAVNNEGTSDFGPAAHITLTVVYTGTIRGMVNSSGNYQVILVEQSKVLSFNSTNYFAFNSLSPGTYHIRIEQSGYEGILKTVTLSVDEIAELGAFTPTSNPLPNGSGNSTTTYTANESQKIVSFSISDSFYSSLLTYRISAPKYSDFPNGNDAYSVGLFTTAAEFNKHPMNPNCILKTPTVYHGQSTVSGSRSFSNNELPAQKYCLVYNTFESNGYMQLQLCRDNGRPQISISKTWANSTESVEVYINCSDSVSGIKNAYYYVSQTTSKPSNFNGIMPQYNVQISNKGTWYLHVQAIDNFGNTTYRCVGPFIIQ